MSTVRRRFVQQPDGTLVEVGADYVAAPRDARDSGVLWNDRLYQDANDPRYTSRTTHREYMAQRGLTTADDFTKTWEQDAKQRKATLDGHDPQRKQDIARAIERLQNGRR